jgi:hypothetical protein
VLRHTAGRPVKKGGWQANKLIWIAADVIESGLTGRQHGQARVGWLKIKRHAQKADPVPKGVAWRCGRAGGQP